MAYVIGDLCQICFHDMTYANRKLMTCAILTPLNVTYAKKNAPVNVSQLKQHQSK